MLQESSSLSLLRPTSALENAEEIGTNLMKLGSMDATKFDLQSHHRQDLHEVLKLGC